MNRNVKNSEGIISRSAIGIILCLAFALHSHTTQAKHLLIFGDSLSAAYGMDLEQGWAALLAASLGPEHKVTNASISGETSAGGLARLPLTLEEFNPDVVMIELGANDGLRGLPVQQMQNNLEKMIQLTLETGAEVILTGISVPPSYGPRYIDSFRQVFKDLALQYELPFIDFYREDFFEKEGYIQDDGLHPTPITQPIVRDELLRFLEKHDLLN